MNRMNISKISLVCVSLLIVGVTVADNGKYWQSPHGSQATGVFRVSEDRKSVV